MSLVQRDYAFLGYRYTPGGVLYRGLRKGLAANIAHGAWLPSVDDGPLAALERELGVFLFSHDLSDALSVSRLWEDNDDAAILVFDAAEFDARWRCGGAAVLGFAEPGVVFRYPFFAEPLALETHRTIFTKSVCTSPIMPRQTVVPTNLAGDRSTTEAWLASTLQTNKARSATPIETSCFPPHLPAN
ncbi:MAG: hypothetical protein U1F34_04005 [Gammaproteobacteria bacterium]